MKKALYIVMMLVLSFTIVVGCSSNTPNSQTSNGNKQQGSEEGEKPVTLEFYTWLSEGTARWQEILPEFYKKYPNIRVNVNVLANNDDANEAMKKLDLAAASGQEMDVVMLNNSTGYVQRSKAGMLAPLEDYMTAEGINYDNIYTASTQIEGKYYALPGRLLTWFVMLNKEKLDEANLEIPKEWTWDEFMEYSRVLTKGEGPSKQYGTYLHNWAQYVMLAQVNNPENNTLLSADGLKPNINNDRIRQSLQITNQIQNVDKSAQSYANVISQKLGYRNEYFGGKAAIIPTGNWMITEAAGTDTFPATFTSVFAPYPKANADDENGWTLATIDYLGLAAKSKHPQEAYDFIRWMTTEGLLLGKMIPAWVDADLDVVIDGLLEGKKSPEMVDKETLKYVLEISKTAGIVSPPSYGSEVQSRYISEIENFLLGQQDLETTITKAEKEIQDIINSNQ